LPVVRLLSALLVSSLLANPATAQVRLPAATPDTNPALTAFRRAQRLVNDGNGGPGRFVVDSLVEAADPGSTAEAQALFWRATLALTWAEAQRDYLRVMLEHERSPLAAESMFRLAQGELAGGDRAAAQRYFERIAREAPEAPIRGEASLWHGRMLIERGARATGCPVLREGRRRVSEAQVELVNQYDYLLQGCPPEAGTPTVAATGATPPSAPAPSAPTASTRTSTSSSVPRAPTVGPSTTSQWSVQLAAFQTRGEAEGMIKRLGARGYGELRVDGEAPPFRVRMGRFATREEAQCALAAYRTKEKGDGFVTPVPAR
jgi:septal ring-binding cell division protein DamX